MTALELTVKVRFRLVKFHAPNVNPVIVQGVGAGLSLQPLCLLNATLLALATAPISVSFFHDEITADFPIMKELIMRENGH